MSRQATVLGTHHGEAGETYHNLFNAVLSGLCRLTLYLAPAVDAPFITLGPLLVTQRTPLHWHVVDGALRAYGTRRTRAQERKAPAAVWYMSMLLTASWK